MRKACNELTAADVMRGDVAAIPEAMSLREAARLLDEAGAGAAPVFDTRGQCVGLLCAADVRRRLAGGEVTDPDPACFWSEWQMVVTDETEVGRRPVTTGTPVPVR